METRSAAVVLASLAVFATACDPDIPQNPPPPHRIVAQFDPSAATPIAPKPNDLAINPSTGLVEVPDEPGATDAEKAFNKYLRTLDGFPTAATATVTFSEPLDPASVTSDSVRVFDVTDPNAVSELTDGVTRTWNDAKKRIEVKAPWAKAHRYAIAVRDGDAGVKGKNGDAVVGSPAFVLLRAKNTLVTCTDLTSSTCASSTSLISGPTAAQDAVTLERARLALKPALDTLDAKGVPRDQLAIAWTFSTAKQPLVTFDPKNQIVPFPNELLMKDGRVNLPTLPSDDAQTLVLKGGLNQLDGFSTTASFLTEAGDTTGATDARIDAATLDPSQFLLVNLANPTETVDVTLECRACGKGTTAPGTEPDQVAIKPAKPLRSHTPYAVFWLKGAKGVDGRPVATGTVFALSRLDTPVAVESRSQLDAVDDVTATLLEPLRAQQAPLFAISDARGIPREDVLLAWSFHTMTVTEPLAQLASLPATTWNLPTNVVGGPANLTDVDLSQLEFASQILGEDFDSHLRRDANGKLVAKEGMFIGGIALDETAMETIDNGASAPTMVPTEGAFTDALLQQPTRENLKFILFLPKVAKYPDGRIPIIIFQHGLTGARRHAALLANTVAAHGYALLAIDAPMHGDRSYCQANNQCKAGTQCVNHRCPGGYLTNANDPTGTPTISGQQFVSTSNPFYTRDHFRQAVIDLAQVIRVAKDTTNGIGAISVDDPMTMPPEKLDPSDIKYIGQSLGGIIGGLATAAIPDITASTLNVPGGSQTDIILKATDPGFAAIKQSLDDSLSARGMPPGSQAYEQFIDTARWIMDPADPQNFGRHFIAEPLTDPKTMMSMPRKYVFVSWTKGDPVVPNYCTQLLLNSIDVGMFMDHFQQNQYGGGDHAFMLDIQNPAFALGAQEDAVKWVEEHPASP